MATARVAGTIITAALFLAAASLAPCTEAQSAPVAAPTFPPESSLAPGPASEDCFTALASMSDCLTYVEAGSNLTVPDKACCPELAQLVASQPICLCQLLGNASDTIGIDIDMKKALKLPGACKVSTPPVSLCSAVGIPVGVPTSSEGPAASPGGMTPGASTDNANGASTTVTNLSIHIGLAIAVLTAVF